MINSNVSNEEEIEEYSEEIASENEAYDIAYDLTSYGIDFPISSLIDWFNDGDIYLPDFQRNYVWTKKQASKFVESILVGLPVPEIFLYEEDNKKMLIIDGYQRINSLSMFKKGIFAENSNFKLNVKS